MFKQEKQLEIWIRRGDRYEQFKTYPICAYSGHRGPKLREGDSQSPEGFYRVGATQMNPLQPVSPIHQSGLSQRLRSGEQTHRQRAHGEWQLCVAGLLRDD